MMYGLELLDQDVERDLYARCAVEMSPTPEDARYAIDNWTPYEGGPEDWGKDR